jgi:hypothetical protein
MHDELRSRVHALEAELAAVRAELDGGAARVTSRRGLLRAAAAAGAAGVVGAAAVARPAAAATGGAVILGQANTADAVTSIQNDGPFPDVNGPGPVALELRSPGGHLRFVGTIGDAILGTHQDGTLAYNGGQGLALFTGGTRVRVAQVGWQQLYLLPTPIRLHDSRNPHPGGSAFTGRLVSGASRNVSTEVDDAGETTELLVGGYSGAMVNVTVVDTAGSGFLSVGNPGLFGTRTTSNINWTTDGQILANLAVTLLHEGFLTVYAGGGGSTHVVVDLLALVG